MNFMSCYSFFYGYGKNTKLRHLTEYMLFFQITHWICLQMRKLDTVLFNRSLGNRFIDVFYRNPLSLALVLPASLPLG